MRFEKTSQKQTSKEWATDPIFPPYPAGVPGFSVLTNFSSSSEHSDQTLQDQSLRFSFYTPLWMIFFKHLMLLQTELAEHWRIFFICSDYLQYLPNMLFPPLISFRSSRCLFPDSTWLSHKQTDMDGITFPLPPCTNPLLLYCLQL